MWKWDAIGQPKAVVVILHSAYEHHAWYAWLIDQLRNEGFQVLTGDLPGHGELHRSLKKHDESFKTYYSFTSKLFDVAFESNLPVYVIANGLGANIAIRQIFKLRPELAGLIVVSPWLQLKLLPGNMSKTLATLSTITTSVKLKHDISITDLTRNLEAQLEMQDDIKFNPVVTSGWFGELKNLMKLLKDHQEIRIPDIPVLMMTGAEDKIIDHSAASQWLIAQKLSSFQFKQFTRAKHSLFLETEREDVFKLTKDFIANHLPKLQLNKERNIEDIVKEAQEKVGIDE